MQQLPILFAHLDKLPYFLVVAEHHSFRKASESLGVTQPAISKAIKNLEEVLGQQLFKRLSKGVTLTPEGEALLKVAHLIKQTSAGFHHSLEMSNQARTLKLATHEVIIPLILHSLNSISKSSLTFNISTDPSVSYLLKKLENFEADVAVVAGSAKGRELHSLPLFRDNYRLFCSKEFLKSQKLKNNGSMTIKELSSLALILTPHVLSEHGVTFQEKFEQRGIELVARHQVESLETSAALVASGHGIGILPERIGPFLTAKKIMPFPAKVTGLSELGHIEFHFCCRKESWKSDQLVKDFFGILRTLYP